MTFIKFTHTLLKHYQASQRPSMKCVKLNDNLFENVIFLEKTLIL